LLNIKTVQSVADECKPQLSKTVKKEPKIKRESIDKNTPQSLMARETEYSDSEMNENCSEDNMLICIKLTTVQMLNITVSCVDTRLTEDYN